MSKNENRELEHKEILIDIKIDRKDPMKCHKECKFLHVGHMSRIYCKNYDLEIYGMKRCFRCLYATGDYEGEY